MPAYARRQIVDESIVGVYYGVARCVRRAFLRGVWVDAVRHLRRRFYRAIGRPPSLAARAAGSGKRWLHGVSASRTIFF